MAMTISWPSSSNIILLGGLRLLFRSGWLHLTPPVSRPVHEVAPGREFSNFMSGMNIHCGTFSGEDKSGSALEGVLDALPNAPAELVRAIKAGFDDSEYTLISEDQAALLLPLLTTYRQQLVTEIGHENWDTQIAIEEAAGLDPVDAKWGAGRGWRLYCTNDLIRACETSIAEHEPIAIVLS